MTKSDLIERVAERVPHISKTDTELVVNTIFDGMTEALRGSDRIEIRGFGSFQVKIREAREGRNPKTGEEVEALVVRVDPSEQKIALSMRAIHDREERAAIERVASQSRTQSATLGDLLSKEDLGRLRDPSSQEDE